MQSTSLKVDSRSRMARASIRRGSRPMSGMTTAEEVPPMMAPKIIPSSADIRSPRVAITATTSTVPMKFRTVRRIPGRSDSRSVARFSPSPL